MRSASCAKAGQQGDAEHSRSGGRIVESVFPNASSRLWITSSFFSTFGSPFHGIIRDKPCLQKRGSVMSKGKKNRKKQLQRAVQFELYGIAILSLSLIAMARLGAMGRSLNYLSRLIVGTWDFILPLGGIMLAGFIMVRRKWPDHWSSRWTGVLLIVVSFLVINHISMFEVLKESGVEGEIIPLTWQKVMEEQSSRLPTDIGGGMIGAFAYASLHFLFGSVGTWIAILAMIAAGILLVTGFSFVQYFQQMRERWNKWLKRWQKGIARRLVESKRKASTKKEGRQRSDSNRKKNIDEGQGIPVIHDFTEKEREVKKSLSKETEQLALFSTPPAAPRAKPELKSEKSSSVVVHFGGGSPMSEYRLPPFSLLMKTKKSERSSGRQNMTANAKKLESTLDSFGVKAKVTQIHRGPAVTRYEVQPDIGVKVSRIVNLSDDLALALAAKDIRIEAPIPGKAAIGIEVPNPEIALVGLRDVLASSSYHEATSKLSIALGRDISGEPIVGDLSKMPHLLVAGATGSGKSVCINGIIISLLYKAKPNEVKLMMIDPKMVELNVYNGVPHLLAPVVTDSRRAAIALKKVVAEMEKRYQLFAKSGARDIERYNQMMRENSKEKEEELLPYIVVIVDELADLMMVAPNDVEDAICRLAQMARAAGIHLIIATQRPSVDVITGLIKANIPSRIAFGVSSQTDSRTILDMGGAEKLLGRGDLLYLPVGEAKPVRIEGSFVSDREVEAVVRFVKEQAEVQYDEKMIPEEAEVANDEEAEDELYSQAVQLVVEAGTASVSLLQRRLRIGYTRAARLIDMMERRRIVGPYEGSRPREVLVTREQWHAQQNVSI